MNAKVFIGILVSAAWSLAQAQRSVPDFRTDFAGRQDLGRFSQVLPALLFFVGLGLIGGLFLLGEMAARKRREQQSKVEGIAMAHRHPRPPFPPRPKPPS